MKPSSIASLFIVAAAFSANEARAESLQECTGPFRACAIEVTATCSRDPDGKLRFTFTDALGNWRRWERCVGRIFEANGDKNPYNLPIGSADAGQQVGSSNLTVPYTEMLFPHNDGRD